MNKPTKHSMCEALFKALLSMKECEYDEGYPHHGNVIEAIETILKSYEGEF